MADTEFHILYPDARKVTADWVRSAAVDAATDEAVKLCSTPFMDGDDLARLSDECLREAKKRFDASKDGLWNAMRFLEERGLVTFRNR